MRHTFAALLFIVGLSACGGVEEAAPEAEERTQSSEIPCSNQYEQCSQVHGNFCGPEGFGRACCSAEDQTQICICQPSGFWGCPGSL